MGIIISMAVISFIIGLLCILCSLIDVYRFKDEVDAVITGIEFANQSNTGSTAGDYTTGYKYVKYKYKGLILKSKVKSNAQICSTIKIRVNPKKPNQCCLPHPYFEGFISCSIFSAFLIYCCIKAKCS